MLINQNGDRIFTEPLLGPTDFSHEELASVVLQLLERNNLMAIRTNATKHGDTEVQLIDA